MRFSGSVRYGLLSVLGLCVVLGSARAEPLSRIREAVNPKATMVPGGNVHPQLRTAADAGRLGGDVALHGLSLRFMPSAEQQADLDELLRQQQDPASPNYHAWLSPAQFERRFGLSQNDLDKVQSWLRGQGFTIDSASPTGVRFSGSVAQIESAFQTEMHRYRIDGEAHFANATELSVPAALSGIVHGVRNLSDFRPKPRFRPARPQFTSGVSGNHFVAPGDFAKIYDINPLYTSGITGSGHKIAVVGQTAINLRDVQSFRTNSGLAANDPQFVLVPNSGSSTVVFADEGESDIDVEWTGGVAQAATILFVYTGNNTTFNVFDALQYAIQNNLAPVISLSYGNCEAGFTGTDFSSLEGLFQQANSQGQTILASSGDTGAADCDFSTTSTPVTSATHGLAVDYPASSAFVTGMGGTEFNEGSSTAYWSGGQGQADVITSARSYIPEIVWNDTNSTNGLAATGGGVSKQFSKPSWQTGLGVPGDGMRDVPDVSMAASNGHDQYLYCSSDSSGNPTCVNGFRDGSGNLTVAGGTSFGSPTFAGVVTLVSQKIGSSGVGNINPKLYQLAAATSDVFHDITSGDNKVPCTSGTTNCPSGGTIGYSAGVGYDQTTGWGTVDVNNLATEWNGSGSSSSSSGGSSSSSSSSSGSSSSSSGGGTSGGGGGGGGGGAWPLASLPLLAFAAWRRRRTRS